MDQKKIKKTIKRIRIKVEIKILEIEIER